MCRISSGLTLSHNHRIIVTISSGTHILIAISFSSVNVPAYRSSIKLDGYLLTVALFSA